MSINNSKQYHINWIVWIFLMIFSLTLLVINLTSKEFNTGSSNYIKLKATEVRYLFDGGIREYFTNLSNKSKMIDQLRDENELLKKQLSNTYRLEIENKYLQNKLNSLNSVLNFIDHKNINNIVSTTIISNSLGSISNNLSIGLGSLDYINNNQLVITNKGILGYTFDVKKKSTKILSVLDNNFKISAITGKTKVNIVIEGNRTITPNVTLYSQGLPIQEGELVYTSGLEGNFPPFIAIGRVIKHEDTKDSWKIELFEDLKDLNYVYIVR